MIMTKLITTGMRSDSYSTNTVCITLEPAYRGSPYDNMIMTN